MIARGDIMAGRDCGLQHRFADVAGRAQNEELHGATVTVCVPSALHQAIGANLAGFIVTALPYFVASPKLGSRSAGGQGARKANKRHDD